MLGVTRWTLTREGKEAPRNPDGTYNPKTLVAWHVKKLDSGVSGEIEKQKLRKLSRENDVAEKRLIDIEVLRPHCSALQDSLRDLGDKLARKKKITGAQAQAMLNKTLRTVASKIVSINGTDG